ncbi:MAG TPA: Uma2 family endonuclease [Ktedonobacteraceae bacterium]|nr:Uma2 family endonuclease [Ktedonobacteraceae bacterium]
MALPHHPLMTVEDYFELDRTSTETRYEYIDGYVRMPAGGTANHATIGVNVTSTLRRLLRGSPCRVYNSDLRVRISETRYVYPDASVSCDERDRGQSDMVRSPRLIVEVLSPGTEAYDRGRKFAYYRERPTIQEYVLIDTQRQAVEVFRREKNSFWTFHAFGPGDEVELVSVHVRVPVDDIYEDVIVPPEHDDQPV